VNTPLATPSQGGERWEKGWVDECGRPNDQAGRRITAS